VPPAAVKSKLGEISQEFRIVEQAGARLDLDGENTK
jgi:hypothetical protein